MLPDYYDSSSEFLQPSKRKLSSCTSQMEAKLADVNDPVRSCLQVASADDCEAAAVFIYLHRFN